MSDATREMPAVAPGGPRRPRGSPPQGLPRRPLLFAGVLVVLAAAVFAAVELTSGHGVPPPPSALPPAVVPTTTTTTTVPGALPKSFPVFAMKDPFAPLVPPYATASSATTSTTTLAAPPTSPPTSSPSAPPSTVAPSPTTTAPSSGFVPTTGQEVALLDVYSDDGQVVAEVRVDSTIYPHLVPGEVFATEYKVVSLDEQTACGQFLYGDSEFELCKGQEILK